MDFTYKDHKTKTTTDDFETWFLNQPATSFPNSYDYVGIYRALKAKLTPIHKQVTQGADEKDTKRARNQKSSEISRAQRR